MTEIQACPNIKQIHKYLGKGGSGMIYEYCTKKRCDKVIKRIDIKYHGHENDVMKEIQTHTLLNQHGIGSHIFQVFFCNSIPKSIDLIIERFDTDLFDTIKRKLSFSPRALRSLKKELNALHELGYVHLDLTTYNVLANVKNGRVTKLTLNDFGHSELQKNIKKDLHWFERLYNHQVKHAQKHLSFMAHSIADHSFEEVKRHPRLIDSNLIYFIDHQLNKQHV